MPFDGTQLNETAAHLIRAKRYMEDHGWCSTGPGTAPGAVCISTAIAFASEHWCHSAGFVMAQALGVEPSYIDGHSIGIWNDTPGRTLGEIFAAFDRAIDLAVAEALAG